RRSRGRRLRAEHGQLHGRKPGGALRARCDDARGGADRAGDASVRPIVLVPRQLRAAGRAGRPMTVVDRSGPVAAAAHRAAVAAVGLDVTPAAVAANIRLAAPALDSALGAGVLVDRDLA